VGHFRPKGSLTFKDPEGGFLSAELGALLGQLLHSLGGTSLVVEPDVAAVLALAEVHEAHGSKLDKDGLSTEKEKGKEKGKEKDLNDHHFDVV